MLQLKNVYKTLGNFKLKNINLNVKDGEYFVILGPTGTGKTVILEIIAGMYHPDKGSLIYENQNFDKLLPEDRNIGFVYQDYALFPHLTIKENIEFGVQNDDINHVDEMLELMDIDHLMHRYPKTLSEENSKGLQLQELYIPHQRFYCLMNPLVL